MNIEEKTRKIEVYGASTTKCTELLNNQWQHQFIRKGEILCILVCSSVVH
jgi:hypothetical protein